MGERDAGLSSRRPVEKDGDIVVACSEAPGVDVLGAER